MKNEIIILTLKGEYRVAEILSDYDRKDKNWVLNNFSINSNTSSFFIGSRTTYSEAYFLACEYRNMTNPNKVITLVDLFETASWEALDPPPWPDNPLEIGH